MVKKEEAIDLKKGSFVTENILGESAMAAEWHMWEVELTSISYWVRLNLILMRGSMFSLRLPPIDFRDEPLPKMKEEQN